MVATAERPAPNVRRPLSGRAIVGITLSILAFLFAFYLLRKVEWTEPPMYPGATVISRSPDFVRNIKETVLISDDILKKVVSGYGQLLNQNHWYDEILGKYFVLDDQSKTFSIFNPKFIYIECPAYYLSVAYEELPDNRTKITIAEFIGPCGSNFK